MSHSNITRRPVVVRCVYHNAPDKQLFLKGDLSVERLVRVGISDEVMPR